ncbi:MAG: enoyl-CoA hydratase/isomerase family protein [Rhodospirillaceae bacterium]|jgi:enoyl-CoA hydratase/carnithine racemase|nr:enoyl-CoA hydratase/isomerase family protein [Rhodospirillaceae bacterium]MBT5242812.1 enoyl-CoA hydratase/isomerase family protein [Rhodospirillaceae bacterium]MBT5564013.1 enoyl-CoA hydratase/isomerase family protein [Rhodospirillaceae bacterium]MBT6243288.1 enoyl-CoA hydratase/isomerase family protein [Rhodospirillaceae bacterium]MBT7137583.1 enoyl-CoA hydratase/isomerase family protein [Rhodospirillaceae bacterium]
MVEFIEVELRDRVVAITLNRPQRKNALSLELLGDLNDALANIVAEEVSAVVLTGAGDCFSAGGDFTTLTGTIDDLAVDEGIEAATSAIRNLPVPVIAAINGPCMGGAFDLAMSCDVRLASEQAVFQVPATRLGLLYNPRSIARLRLLLGRDAVFRIMIMGERLDAQAALKDGIVSQVIAGDGCLKAAMVVAESTHANVPAAVAATKGFLNAFDGDNFDPAHWQKVYEELLSSPARAAAVSKAKDRHGKS